MNMKKVESVISDTSKKVLDAIVFIKNKEKAARDEKKEGAPEVDLESIIQKLSEKKKETL
jgi:hypothetical protein